MGTSAFDPAVAPIECEAAAFAIAFPAERLEAASNSILIRLRPLGARLLETAGESLGNGSRVSGAEPRRKYFFPGIRFEAFGLLARGMGDEFGCFEPPDI